MVFFVITKCVIAIPLVFFQPAPIAQVDVNVSVNFQPDDAAEASHDPLTIEPMEDEQQNEPETADQPMEAEQATEGDEAEQGVDGTEGDEAEQGVEATEGPAADQDDPTEADTDPLEIQQDGSQPIAVRLNFWQFETLLKL